jgi:hypothetical protein
MKKILFIPLALLVTACSDKPVPPTELPQEIQAFVKQHFPTQTISYADKDWEWFSYKYDVTLADGTQISFDTDNVWDKVESKMAAVPTALVPAPIATYINTNFPAIAITKIDKERHGYDVDLANDLELKFNEQGALMEMDD